MFKHIHDVRLVLAFAELERQEVICGSDIKLGIALFEYLFQVPANRAGYTALSLPQLKILQEVITPFVFAPYAVLYMHQAIKLDYLWAGLCLVGAVYFIFRS